jgi:DNA-binding IscR family transcriptional regulator
MEGPIAVNDCVDGAQDSNIANNCCFVSQNWNRVNLAIRNALDDVSLEDLIDPAQLFAPADQFQAKGHEAPSALQSEMLS